MNTDTTRTQHITAIVASIGGLAGRKRLDALRAALEAHGADRTDVEEVRAEIRAMRFPTRVQNDLYEVLDEYDESLFLAALAARMGAA